MDVPPDVGEKIVRLNELLRSQRILTNKLAAVADLVQLALPGCDGASIALIVEEAAVTGAASSQIAIEADMVQYRSGEGPCLSAVDQASTVRIDLLSHDESYEHFAPAAMEIGVESVLSIPLLEGDAVVGSINVYSSEPAAFADGDPDRIAHLRDYASGLIAESHLYRSTVDLLERLIEMVDDADHVEIAIGVLIVRLDMTASEAWEHLGGLAAAGETSIIAAARRLVDDHEQEQRDR